MIASLSYMKQKSQVYAVMIMVLCCLLLSITINLHYGINIVYTHLFYIPIILASTWCGKNGVNVAIVLGGIHIISDFLYRGVVLPEDIIRSVFFVLVAILVWQLTDKRHLAIRETAVNDRHLVGEMAVAISHEMRNPLTSARGFLQLMKDTADDEQKEIFNLIIEELDQANFTISQFLSLSQQKTANLVCCNLNDIIKELLPQVNERAEQSGVITAVRLEDLPKLLLDFNEMIQLVWHLSLNSIEAMPKGGLLTIETKVNENNIQLLVTDEGKGINPELLPKLGTPFVTDKAGGAGLGMAVCYSIAARHRAEINIATSPKGTIVTVNFPL